MTQADHELQDELAPDVAEEARLAELARYGLLDTAPEAQFDRVAELARVLFDTPQASITLVDRNRQWFKARVGLDGTEAPRSQSFCNQAMQADRIMVVPDALEDDRFAENPFVTGAPNIRFYAGVPLRGEEGHRLGALCVISPEPRAGFSEEDTRKLEALAGIVEREMELKLRAREAHRAAFDRDQAVREAQARIRSSLDYATLLTTVKSSETPTDKLVAIAGAAWAAYSEAGAVVSASVKSLRERMSAAEYRKVLDGLPGFAM